MCVHQPSGRSIIKNKTQLIRLMHNKLVAAVVDLHFDVFIQEKIQQWNENKRTIEIRIISIKLFCMKGKG